MTTIVSAFLTNVNNFRDIEKYIEYGRQLLLADCNKVVFIDELLYDKLSQYENNKTHLIKFNKSMLYFYEYLEKISNFSLDTTNHSKDTLDYIFIMCHKTEWMKQAIELDLYKTEQFVWIDFGIRHIFNCTDDEYRSKLETLSTKISDRVRIPTIWDLNAHYHSNPYKAILWYFAGGVFGGNKDKLLLFADLMKTKCLQIIETEHTLMWEVNVWYFIYNENKEIFDAYYGNHNHTIIDNY
jgi:hypothetical protein